MSSFFKISTFTVLALIFVATACEEYDAPPDVRLVLPAAGAYTVDESLELRFTEAIQPETLAIQIWPGARGTRHKPNSNVQPLAGPCSVNRACSRVDVDISSNGRRASVTIKDDLARAGVPMVLEVQAGLADLEGNDTGVGRFFDFQFRGSQSSSDEPVEFDSGVYILGGEARVSGLRAILTLVANIEGRSDGRFVIAGAKGVVDNDAEPTTRNPEEITIDESDEGWTLYARGRISVQEDGTRLLESDAFEVDLVVSGLQLRMQNVRLFAEIRKAGENDFIDATLSWEKLQLGDPESPNVATLDGSSAALQGDWVPEPLIPEGHPEVCGNLCGAVNGLCAPPAQLVDEDFCDFQPSE